MSLSPITPMSGKMEFIKRVDAKTTDLVMKTVNKHYSHFLQLGVLFLNLRPQWWRLSFFQLVIYHLTTFYFASTLVITTVKLADDIGTASQSAYLTLALFFMIGSMLNFTLKRDELVGIMTIVGNDYYHYSDNFKPVKVEKWKKDLQKKKIIFMAAVPVYFLSTLSLGTFIAPWIDELQDYKPIDFINGVYMKLPIPMWFPYNINNYAVHLLTIASIIIGGIMLSSVILAVILLLFFQSQDLNFQMNILFESIKYIEEIAAELYQERFGKLDVSNKKDKKYSKILNFCIKENVEHHKILFRVFNHIYSLSKWLLAGTLLICSILIALTFFNIVSADKERIAPQLFSVFVILFQIACTAFVCFTAQEISDMSNNVYWELYSIKCMEYSKDVNTSILIMKENLKKPMLLKAGGITVVNRQAFTNIMNTAFTYLNMLLAFHERS